MYIEKEISAKRYFPVNFAKLLNVQKAASDKRIKFDY